MNAIAYLRATDELGLDKQDRNIREYAKANKISIARCVTDTGEERASLDELAYGVIANPPIQAVIVSKSDRVSGDVNLYYYYKMCLAKKDLVLISIESKFDPAAVEVLESFVISAANAERENIRKKKYDGKMEKARKGGYAGGRAPYGYDAIRGSGELVVNKKEAVMVKRIFELHDEHSFTMRAIVEVLKKEKYKTRTDNDFQVSTVGSIIGNRKTYQGYVKYGGCWIEGKHEKIL